MLALALKGIRMKIEHNWHSGESDASLTLEIDGKTILLEEDVSGFDMFGGDK